VSLERYRGLTVAVDAMSWLHKGIFACDVKVLAKSQRFGCGGGLGDGKPRVNAVSSPSSKCIEYVISKAEILREKFGIEVILVIDGDALPSKDDENSQRREDRDSAFEKALAAEKAHDSRTARRLYAQSCSVTHEMRYDLIQRCNQVGIAFIVAPFEADAQMARLVQTGIVDLVITEDSDILVYGCPRALFKVDFTTYQGQEIQLMKNLGDNNTPSFRNWTHDMFVFMCIISGCDYCKGIPGIGIKLAHKIVRVHRTPSKIFNALRAANRMPPDFEEKFFIAFRTFRHQRVYCPSKQQIETLWPITSVNDYHHHHPGSVNEEKWPFLGGFIEPHIARGIADGTLHPKLHIPWDEALKVVVKHTISATKVDDETSTRNHRVVAAIKNNNNNDKQKSNIWYSLVYDKPTAVVNTRRSNTFNDENEKQQPLAQDNLPSKRDMFRFFSKNTNRNQKADKYDDTVDAPPPLPVISVGLNSDIPQTSKPNPSNCYVPPPHHRDVPLHFNEYASRLVGRTFNPISRKRRRLDNDGSKSAKYVQTIWAKCGVKNETETQAASVMLQEPKIDMMKADEGVRRFMKDSRTEKKTILHYNEIEHYSNTDYNNNNESAHLGHAIQQYTDCDDGLASFSKQDCHLPTSYCNDDRDHHHMIAETLNWDAKDLVGSVNDAFFWNKGNCIDQEDVSSHTFHHLSIFESGSYEGDLPPPSRQSSYRQSEYRVDSRSSSYSEIQERDLLLELHNVYEPPRLSSNNDTDCYITHDRYDGINYDDTEYFGVDDRNPYEPQTCRKQNNNRAFLPPLPLVRHEPKMVYSSFADTEAINDNIIESSFYWMGDEDNNNRYSTVW
jgi:exonuclease-1